MLSQKVGVTMINRWWSRLKLTTKILVSSALLVLAGTSAATYWLADQMHGELQSRIRERGVIIQKQIEVTRAYVASQYVAKIKQAARA